MKGSNSEQKFLDALGDFTSRENWDEFFRHRSREPFEWYGGWSNLAEPLAQLCGLLPSQKNPLDILVPGCGNSELSEKLYDAGFKRITNIDFSKVVIADMLRKHLRSRPGMLWRVMDMTRMQFSDGSFDVVLDKGGLDALMEPVLGPKLGIQFLSEVKRVLRTGGKYICVSLVQKHVLELLFSKFRFGWQITIHAIPQKSGSVSSYHPFLVAATKEDSTSLHLVTRSFDPASLRCNNLQVQDLLDGIAKENELCNDHAIGKDILYSMEELQIGAKGDMEQLIAGRRISIMLEEGQWQVVESAKAGRLIMVFLDAKHSCIGMEDVQKDLSPLVEGIAPARSENGPQIPFMMASDGISTRTTVQEVVSPLTGRITVEDVVFLEKKTANTCSLLEGNEVFRRLVFERSPGLVQSEALLRKSQVPVMGMGTARTSEPRHHSKSGKKKHRANKALDLLEESENNLKVDHNYLASLYHGGMIAGFGLIIFELEQLVFSEKLVKTVVIGLGAGLLPMFLHEHMPYLKIKAIELDPVVADLARQKFGFIEDERMKLHIGDGVQIVKEMANVSKSLSANAHFQPNTLKNESLPANKEILMDTDRWSTEKNNYHMEAGDSGGIHVLIIDTDSDDPSTGLTCPHSSFVEKSFLESARESLVPEGILILNLVSRSTSVYEMVVSRMEMVFEQLFSLEIEEDVNKILFALPKKAFIDKDGMLQSMTRLEKLLTNFSSWGSGPNIKEYARKMKCLK